jgi:uncharacterized protein (TIGR03437 family)
LTGEIQLAEELMKPVQARVQRMTRLMAQRLGGRRRVTLLALLLAPVLAAQTANWTRQAPIASPSPRGTPALAFDSTHGQVVLFGGFPASGVINDTWAWNGSTWTQELPPTSPPARSNHAMVYDAAHKQVVLFGGSDGANNLSDTWVWDGTNWAEKSPQASPPARYGHAMAFDSAHGQVVLFGGVSQSGVGLNDTWVWDGSNWTKKSPQTSPPAAALTAMAYDTVHGQVVLFGGSTGATFVGSTWVWDGTNWTQKSPQNNPPARNGHAMAYDSAQGQVVLFAGTSQVSNALNDTWVWDGSNWNQKAPQTSPPARTRFAMTYDSVHNKTVLFGGRTSNGGYDGDTWTWVGGAPPPVLPSISTVVSASSFGGFAMLAPGSWIEIYGSNLGPDKRGWTGADFTGNNAPTSLDGVKVDIGGQEAFVDYISPGQVNAQLPSNIATGGTLELTVMNSNGASAPMNVTVNPTRPGLLASAPFKIGANQYVVAQLPDGNYVLPTGAIPGVNSRPAKPGETIVIYGIGFGSVVPDIPAGEIATQANQLVAPLQILFGQTRAQLAYSGLAPSFVGLYQFNVVVPAVSDGDLISLTFNLGGVAGTQGLFTAVQH